MEKGFILATFAFVLVLQSLLVSSADMDDAQKKECLKLSKRTLKSMMKSFNKCNDQLGYHRQGGEVYNQKIGCVVKCVMKSVNVLDENDIMTPELLKKSLENNVPEHFRKEAHDKLMACVDKNKLDPKDENCKTYLDMGTCMQGSMVDMCGEAPMM